MLAALASPLACPRAEAQTNGPPTSGAMGDMAGMDMSHMDMPGMDMGAMNSGLGSYPMTRDASGSSWQPDASRHEGLHWTADGWRLMAHALIDGVYDDQSGPRGGDKAFVAGMAMIEAQRDLSTADTLTLRGMFSPDPLMGPNGYPLLLATGETANGVTPLSAAVSHRFDSQDSLFVYAGLPGEPALGPPAFMHRMSGMDDPQAPITHHWLDSTHITFGVVTAGWTRGDVRIEVSTFNGREPDQNRYIIESPKLDSESARISWNPGPNWSLQTSWGHLTSPEQLEPTVNENRLTASAIYTRSLGPAGWWSSTLAFGSKQESYGQTLNGWLAETALKPSAPWTLFARAESERNNELTSGDAPEPAIIVPTQAYTVSELTLGAIHDWKVSAHLKFGLGALYTFDFVPSPLSAAYGDDPRGTMVFMRLKVG
jgi:hypothetical protein